MQEVRSRDISIHRHKRLTLLKAEKPRVQLILLQRTHAARSRRAKGASDIVMKDSRCKEF